jgi:hypothetical protein
LLSPCRNQHSPTVVSSELENRDLTERSWGHIDGIAPGFIREEELVAGRGFGDLSERELRERNWLKTAKRVAQMAAPVLTVVDPVAGAAAMAASKFIREEGALSNAGFTREEDPLSLAGFVREEEQLFDRDLENELFERELEARNPVNWGKLKNNFGKAVNTVAPVVHAAGQAVDVLSSFVARESDLRGYSPKMKVFRYGAKSSFNKPKAAEQKAAEQSSYAMAA